MSWQNQSLTILTGETDSALLNIHLFTRRSVLSILIIAPGTLPETVTIRVSSTATGQSATLQSGGFDIVLPADKATQITVVGAGYLKLVANGAVAADRTFDLVMSREYE